jgi:colanic acid biosynthesis glycosyl transferase WcaI
MAPHYPTGRVNPDFRGIKTKCTCENGINVIRIPIPSMDREKFTNRLVQFVVYQIGATLAGINKRFDSVIISNPFFCSLLPLVWQSVILNKPTIYSVYDVYPDVGIKLGVFKQKTVVNIVSYLEKYCLNHSTKVQILSESFIPILLSMGVKDSKINMIHPWVDTKFIHPMSRENSFSEENELTNCFVILYAGNIGLSQGLETMLTAAQLLLDYADIQFVFVGDGSGRDFLQLQAKERKLSNIRFIPFQPRERLPQVLASADISVVILRHGIGAASMPSKVFSIMASGRPILVSVDENSETCKFIKKADAGVWVPPEDPNKLAETILNLKNNKDLRDRLGLNGRIWAEENHSPEYAAEQFENLLFDAVQVHKV